MAEVSKGESVSRSRRNLVQENPTSRLEIRGGILFPYVTEPKTGRLGDIGYSD
jgi:hypothetical protein